MQRKTFFSHVIIYFLLVISGIAIFACNSPYVSKKRGYYAITLPQRKYQLFNQPDFP